MIKVQVNGRSQELPAGITVLAYLEQIGANPKAVAVELDGEILDRSAYATAPVRQGSVMEIVRMVGGGATHPVFGATSREPAPTRRVFGATFREVAR